MIGHMRAILFLRMLTFSNSYNALELLFSCIFLKKKIDRGCELHYSVSVLFK